MESDQKYNKNPIKHFIDGIYTKQEARKALELLRDKSNDQIIDKQMSEVWKQIKESSMSNIFEYNLEMEKAKNLLRQLDKTSFYKKYFRISITAACIALLISFGVVGYKYFNSNKMSDLHYTEASTGYGEKKEIILPDGTITILNACSHLSYPDKFINNERHVKLKGEAYFQVTKNEKQPFIINTEKFDVRVLGTEFNVKAYSDDMIQSVNVKQGKVQVDMPEAMARLYENEQIEINTLTNSHIKEESEYKDISVWRTGILRFNKTPIEDVAKQLERIYNYRIVFEQGQSFENILSGEHDGQNLKEILASIQLATGIKWKTDEKNNNVIILYK